MNAQPFHKPEPQPPDKNKQMRGLRWSLRVSVLGWIVYGPFAYAFTDVQIIPPVIQSALVLVGSLLIVAGAESNTIATAEAALSKLGTDRISKWDFAAVIASLVGGICTPLIIFSTRQPELAGTWWRRVAVSWGPLILGIAGVLDFYGAVTELALAKRDYGLDWAAWWDEKAAWNEKTGYAEPVTLKTATMTDLRRIVGEVNGEWAAPDAPSVAQLADRLRLDDLVFSSKSTGERWARKVRQGKVN